MEQDAERLWAAIKTILNASARVREEAREFESSYVGFFFKSGLAREIDTLKEDAEQLRRTALETLGPLVAAPHELNREELIRWCDLVALGDKS